MTRLRPLRHLPICTPEDFLANDFIPYGLGVTANGDQIVFNRSYQQLWRYHPDSGEIEALNPDVHLWMRPERFFRTSRNAIDWKLTSSSLAQAPPASPGRFGSDSSRRRPGAHLRSW